MENSSETPGNNGANLTITGDNNLKMTVERFFMSNAAREKVSGNTKGLIMLCEIKTGKISTGQEIHINGIRGYIPDYVVRIEENRQPIKEATTGQQIGICLQNTGEKILKKKLLPKS